MKNFAYVYSTMAAPVIYHQYDLNHPVGDKGLYPILRSVRIEGGANVANPLTIMTPKGVVTGVSEEDLKFLEKDTTFKTHLKNGHLKIEYQKTKIEKAVSDMNARDKSAPITPEICEKDGKKAKPMKKNKLKWSPV